MKHLMPTLLISCGILIFSSCKKNSDNPAPSSSTPTSASTDFSNVKSIRMLPPNLTSPTSARYGFHSQISNDTLFIFRAGDNMGFIYYDVKTGIKSASPAAQVVFNVDTLKSITLTDTLNNTYKYKVSVIQSGFEGYRTFEMNPSGNRDSLIFTDPGFDINAHDVSTFNFVSMPPSGPSTGAYYTIKASYVLDKTSFTGKDYVVNPSTVSVTSNKVLLQYWYNTFSTVVDANATGNTATIRINSYDASNHSISGSIYIHSSTPSIQNGNSVKTISAGMKFVNYPYFIK